MIKLLKSYRDTCREINKIKKEVPFKERLLLSLESYNNSAFIFIIPIGIVFNLFIFVKIVYTLITIMALIVLIFKFTQQYLYYKSLNIKEKHLLINNLIITFIVVINIYIFTILTVRRFI